MKGRSTINRVLSRFLMHFILVTASISILFSLYYLSINSFKTMDEYSGNRFGLPSVLNVSNVVKVLTIFNFGIYFKNSLIISGISVLLTVFLGSLAAYAFSKMNFKGRDTIFFALIATMLVSPLILLIPLFVQMRNFHLVNTFTGVILIYTTFNLPLAVYLLTKSFKSIPNSLLDAAKMDGCGSLYIYYKIILPLSKPLLATLSILVLLEVWNDLLIALIFLPEEDMYTLMIGIASFQGKYFVDVPLLMSGLFLTTIPMLTVYMFAQRYFIKGLFAGAVKG